MIYRTQLGDDHDKTRESSECLKHLTQQAVVLQKKMNEIYTGRTKSAFLPPIQIQPPSMGSVLDMLNVIYGILFVQISQQDIDSLKSEEGRQPTRREESDRGMKGTKPSEFCNRENASHLPLAHPSSAVWIEDDHRSFLLPTPSFSVLRTTWSCLCESSPLC